MRWHKRSRSFRVETATQQGAQTSDDPENLCFVVQGLLNSGWFLLYLRLIHRLLTLPRHSHGKVAQLVEGEPS